MNRTFVFIVVILLLGAGYFVMTRMGTLLNAQNSETTPANLSKSIQVTTAKVNEETPAYLIDVQYPKFGIAAIDGKVQRIVEDTITEFKGYPANPPEMSSPQNELTIRYETPYVGPDVVSVKLIISEYTGGAHPNSLFSGLNFARSTGAQLLQSDAFVLTGLTVQQVSAQATAQLKAKLGDTMFEEGVNTNPENFSSFVISADRVTFIFQPYQVAAYAAGPQEVSFERK